MGCVVSTKPRPLSPPGKTWYPLYRTLCGAQGRSGCVRQFSPPLGFDARTIQPVASRYKDWVIPAHFYIHSRIKSTKYPSFCMTIFSAGSHKPYSPPTSVTWLQLQRKQITGTSIALTAGILLLEPCISLIYAWKTNKCTNYSFSLLINNWCICCFFTHIFTGNFKF
jgi:hypothetical protein